MVNTKNISKQIISEKGEFILKNSNFFNNCIKENETFDIISLKNILLNPTPLKQCLDYEDLMNSINNYKKRNIKEVSYLYSLDILFHIVKIIRKNSDIDNRNITIRVDIIREYIKFITAQTNGIVYYQDQNMINIDIDKNTEIVENDNQYKKIKNKK